MKVNKLHMAIAGVGIAATAGIGLGIGALVKPASPPPAAEKTIDWKRNVYEFQNTAGVFQSFMTTTRITSEDFDIYLTLDSNFEFGLTKTDPNSGGWNGTVEYIADIIYYVDGDTKVVWM